MTDIMTHFLNVATDSGINADDKVLAALCSEVPKPQFDISQPDDQQGISKRTYDKFLSCTSISLLSLTYKSPYPHAFHLYFRYLLN